MKFLRPERPSLIRAALAVTAGCVAMAMTIAGPAFGASRSSITVHLSSESGLGTPTGPTTNLSNCPAPVINDFTSLVATGNGVQHENTNPAGDFWGTSTFEGTGTVSFFPASQIDLNGNPTGTPEMVVAGHLVSWFGISFNNKNAVETGTVNFVGTIVSGSGAGNPITFHDVTHGAYLPGADQSGPPSFFFNVASCS